MADIKQEEHSNGHSRDEEKEKALANSQITNSNDRKLKEARIFVGNLPADLRTEKGEVYDKFRKHGPIMGVSVHGRFAFVQFHSEADAKAACKAETGSEFRSARLEVKMALEGKGGRADSRDRDRRRSRSPVDRRRDSRDRGDRDRSRDRGLRRSRDRRDSRPRSPVSTYIPSPVEERFCHPRTYGANDVEMVVIRKSQGEYADSILRRLYDRRISANMLFLAEHASLDGAVNEFGRCGTRYVITVMPKHEETRAITINIFEGDQAPREVRNINVEEGVNLIYRHFREHFPALARLREMELQGPGFYPVPPSEVQRTMSRMLETGAVPTSSLDATIRYLQDMRERTAIAEGMMPQAPPAPAMQYRPEPDLGKALFSSEDSLRDSVLGLLKATGIVGAVPGAAVTQTGGYMGGGDYGGQYGGYTGSASGAAGIANPAVAKALENLVTTGLLRQNPNTGVSATPSGQTQAGRQNSPAVHASSIPSYRTSQGDMKPEENGAGGGTLYVSQGNQQQTVSYPQAHSQQQSSQQPGAGSGGYSMGQSGTQGGYGGVQGSVASGGYSQSAVGQGGYAPRSVNVNQQQQQAYQSVGQSAGNTPQSYAAYSMQRQQMPTQAQQAYSSQRR